MVTIEVPENVTTFLDYKRTCVSARGESLSLYNMHVNHGGALLSLKCGDIYIYICANPMHPKTHNVSEWQ